MIHFELIFVYGVGFRFSSVSQFSHSVVSDSLWPHEPQHAKLPCPSPNPRVHPDPCPLSWWCHPAISSSIIPFSSCPQSFPPSGSFPVSRLFISDGQSIGVSASASVLPMNTQDWSPLGWTGWISLPSKGLSRVFSNTTVRLRFFFWLVSGCPVVLASTIYWNDYSSSIDKHIYFCIPTMHLMWASQVARQWRTHLPIQKMQIRSLGWEDPLEEEMATHPVFLPGESHRQRSLVGYGP